MITWLTKAFSRSSDPRADDLASGIAAYRAGDLQRARQVIENVVYAGIASAPALKALGDVYGDLDRLNEAKECYQGALSIQPDYAEALNNLGLLLRQTGDFVGAAEKFRNAIAAKPGLESAEINLADALEAQGDSKGAIACLEEVLTRNPASVYARNNLALAYADLGNWEEAEKHYRIGVHHDPGNARLWSNLSLTLRTQSRTAESLVVGSRAIECAPDDATFRSQYLLTTNYSDALTADEVWSAHQDFEKHLNIHSDWKPNATPLAARRLRVGYISADFGFHVVSFFIEPVLREHDKEAVEVFCYHNAVEDAQTKKLRRMVSHWRSVHGRDDTEVIDIIRADCLDVLIDLSGHTGGNRLTALAHRVALRQGTWLGYPNTTGLSAIDFRITDGQADPEGMTEHLHSEKLVRLLNGFICYQPRPEAPLVSELPASQNGYVTFGCFNNPAKLTDFALRMWAELLKSVPHSRVSLKGKGLDHPSIARGIRERFAGVNGDVSKLVLQGDVRTFEGHLAAYHSVDIALDSYPYNGTTTTCEALYMGCPVISLAGDRHAARVGASILTRIGHPEWIATDPGNYVRVAAELASDLSALASTRANLRNIVMQSPLTDAAKFTRTLESTYRALVDQCINAKFS